VIVELSLVLRGKTQITCFERVAEKKDECIGQFRIYVVS
jgi:hypothetical protein